MVNGREERVYIPLCGESDFPLFRRSLGEVTRATSPNFSDEGQGHTTRIFEG